jgi:hypothetical protein
MTETATSSEFLLGLEEYLKYLEQPAAASQLHAVSRSLQAAEPKLAIARSYLQQLSAVLPPQLVDLADLVHGITKNSQSTEAVYRTVLTYCARVLKTQGLGQLARDTDLVLKSMDQEDFDQFVVKTQLLKLDQLFPKNKIFRSILNYLKLDLDNRPLQDAFSRSQMRSKIWLIEQLALIRSNYANVAILAGWFGQIKTIYDQQLTYGKMRVVELDKAACEISDYVFNLSNLENHKVKAVCANINQLTLHKNGYEWNVENFRDGTAYSEKFLPDLIINTSAEHMTEEWYHQLRFKQLDSDPIVAIQSNNLFEIAEHVNCVYSVDHMMKKFPMREVLFAGELQLKGYKRVMLIGRP